YSPVSFASDQSLFLSVLCTLRRSKISASGSPPFAAPRITVVGSYATGLTMKVQRLPSTEADFRDVLSGWLFWAFAQHRSASASAVFAARIASSTPSSRDSIWNGKPAPSPYLTQVA